MHRISGPVERENSLSADNRQRHCPLLAQSLGEFACLCSAKTATDPSGGRMMEPGQGFRIQRYSQIVQASDKEKNGTRENPIHQDVTQLLFRDAWLARSQAVSHDAEEKESMESKGASEVHTTEMSARSRRAGQQDRRKKRCWRMMQVCHMSQTWLCSNLSAGRV